MTKKTCIVTGILGQVASYLTELLLNKGYTVIGCRRRAASPNYENIKHLLNNKNLIIEEMELTDYSSVSSVILKYNPEQIYNTAGQSFVKSSYDSPHHTFNVNVLGVLNILETLRLNKLFDTRLLQYSTSEVFGKNFDTKFVKNPKYGSKIYLVPPLDYTVEEKYQDENTEPMPQSPYSISKLASQTLVTLYRESYGLKCCSVISFNMESPKRGKEFVTRKITDYIGRLVRDCSIMHKNSFGVQSSPDRLKEGFVDIGFNNGFSFIPEDLKNYPKLKLGNINSYRDWTHCQDSVEGHYRILNHEPLQEYVISSGHTHSIKDFCDLSFRVIGLNYEDHIEIDPQFYRPSEVDYLLGDSNKARGELNWFPKITFDELVKEMVYADIERAHNE